MANQGSSVAEDSLSWYAVMQRPKFPQAACALARNMLLACDEDARLRIAFRDAGTYITAMSAIYLHRAGGLTLARLKKICVGSGFLSAGRARSLLQVLHHIGYLDPMGSPRATIYVPTTTFVSAWRRHLQLAMLAAAVLEPSLIELCEQLETPGVFERLLAVQAARLHRVARGPDPSPGLRRAFMDPSAGSQILWALVVAGEEADFPPKGELQISLGQMAVRFGVARIHVRRVLAGAEREGLLRYQPGGSIVFLDAGLHSVRLHFALQIAELIGTANEAGAAFEKERNRDKDRKEAC